MRKKNILLIILGIFAISCQKNSLVELTYSGNTELVGFNLKTENNGFNLPLSFIGGMPGNAGTLFFETNAGKSWLKGKPDTLINTEDRFEAIWTIDERKITVRFGKKEEQYNFSFTSEPDTGILKWGIGLSASENEYFTGLFERTVDGIQTESWKEGIREALNIRGQKIDMLIKPTLSLYCPFYLSSAGYGLFIEGTWPGSYDLCKTDSSRILIEFEGPSMSGIIYTSAHPADIVKAHSRHVGPTIVPPRWAFLPWRWRDNHTNNKNYFDNTPANTPYNSMLVEDILMMKALDIPCGVYWVDRPWAKGIFGYEDFEWDDERFPEAEQMITWLHKNNTRFLLWIAPWVVGEMRTEALEKKYYVPGIKIHGDVDSAKVAMIDFTNPAACSWWQEKGIEKMLKQGVDGFKLDRSEELMPETRNIILSNGKTAREERNEYPVLYVKTVNESCRLIHGDDFMLIPRAGYTYSARYSGFWGGDIGSPQEGLRTAIIALQRSSVIGFPIWGSDIGGYWQGDLDREVCARWLAFGCFCPVMEFGPTEDRAPWNMKKEPHYDSELIAVWRLYAKIHASLADYSYNLAKEANETGMPVVRPLFLEYPEQPEAWADWQTYQYGPDILVSAIWEKGTKTHTLYLPAGTRWKDAWEPEHSYEGGQSIEIETPLYKIPVFIKADSKINLGNLNKLYRESLEIASVKPDLQVLEKKMKW